MYSVSYHCSNCNYTFTQRIPKGQRAPNPITCPRCECHTGRKLERVQPILKLRTQRTEPIEPGLPRVQPRAGDWVGYSEYVSPSITHGQWSAMGESR